MALKAPTLRPFHLYLLGTGSWFLAFGIQSVMFAWLVTMVLHESPQMVGIAQMTMLVPTMLLILVGGSLADVIGGRRIVLIAQGVAVLPPLLLCVAAWTGNLTFKAMLLYAVTMGLAQAFVTPARDGLLNHVAEGGIQSAVVRASVMQFGVQIAGLAIASLAENVGPGPILLVQAIVLAIGVRFFSQIPDRLAGTGPVQRPWRDLGRSIAEGYRTIAASPSMRMTLLMSCAMGTCFMGSYIVTLPLLVREYYAGSAQDLALMNAANSIGLVTTIVILMRFGDIRRQGRALLIAQGIGALMLGSIGIGVSFTVLLVLVYVWGMGGGIAMSMSRTIMQEQAPDDQRSRVMSFYSFAFMGSGPIGALLNGFAVQWIGPRAALALAAATMFVVVAGIAYRSTLWRLDPTLCDVQANNAATAPSE
ncbi:MAG TPA: MFS transporter [Pseudomonadales bacterium]